MQLSSGLFIAIYIGGGLLVLLIFSYCAWKLYKAMTRGSQPPGNYGGTVPDAALENGAMAKATEIPERAAVGKV